MILGPGVNIKRNPLGGPLLRILVQTYLAGHEAVGIGRCAVQGRWARRSALRRQQSGNLDRLRVDRASASVPCAKFTSAFEYIVKKAQPWTIIVALQRISGVHSAQNHWLLTNVLRDEWGFEGIIMSDWGADHDRGASLNAGLNLEMPPKTTPTTRLSTPSATANHPAQLDRMAQGMIDLVNKTRAAMSIDNYRFDVDAHDEVAHQAAIESIVMLKNDDAICR